MKKTIGKDIIVPVQTVADVITCLHSSGFTVSETCGYDIINNVATRIMKAVAKEFGVKENRRYESEDREGGLIVTFSPEISEARWNDYEVFLGCKKEK